MKGARQEEGGEIVKRNRGDEEPKRSDLLREKGRGGELSLVEIQFQGDLQPSPGCVRRLDGWLVEFSAENKSILASRA